MPVSLVNCVQHRRVLIIRPVVIIDDALLRHCRRRPQNNNHARQRDDRQDPLVAACSGDPAQDFRLHKDERESVFCHVSVGRPAAFHAKIPPARWRAIGKALLLRRERGRHRTAAGAAGKHHVAPRRRRNGGGIECRQRHQHGVGKSLDGGLVRLAHVDQDDAALLHAARNFFRRQIAHTAGVDPASAASSK